MPLFFVTSGIFFHLGNIFQKVKRLLIPLFSFNFIALCFFRGKDVLQGQELDILSVILDFFGLSCNYPPNPPLWFLFSLIEIMLMAHFMIKCMKPSFVIVLSIIVGIAGYLLESRFSKLPLSILPSMMCLPHFTIGYFLRNKILALKTKHLLLALLVSILVFVIRPAVPTLSDGVIPQGYILFFMSSFLGSIGVYGICRVMNGYIGEALDYYGRNSLIVLSTHWFLLSIPYHLLGIINSGVIATFGGFVVMLILEIPIIYLINKKISFLLGK